MGEERRGLQSLEKGQLLDDSFEAMIRSLPPKFRTFFYSFGDEVAMNIEEIRIKGGERILFYSKGQEYRTDIPVVQQEVEGILAGMLSYSIYSHQDALSKGFITLPGGHRVGVCGRVIVEEGQIKGIKEISSLNIRRSREVIGCAGPIMRHVLSGNRVRNCLLVSPPGCGKTTLLRDIIRSLSQTGFRVSVVDERSELAGMYRGSPQRDLGPRTDILDGCMKVQGISMMIRSMGPQVICCDEIGRQEDLLAIQEALASGVSVITTVHGGNFKDLERSFMGAILSEKIFQRLFFLTDRPRPGRIVSIFDEKGERLE